MKLPVSWLKEFVNTNASIEEISEALVNVGFEVEEVIKYGEDISGVVVGKITAIEAHPDADKLRVCAVDVGKEPLIIVTGAKNVDVGDVVPVALDGARLPSGKEIKAAPLRGVMSYGMMCSGGELNISEAFVDGASVDGILILDKDTEIGADIVEALNLKEAVLDVSITANRSDCHSVLGLCREVATALKAEITMPSFEFTTYESDLKFPSVKITSPDCPVYSSALIKDVKIEKSPKWMQRRLFMSGINPINNVVDVTNYVLLEIGQPLHAFDLNMIEGGINVRNAKQGEEITALNGETYKLASDMTLICDEKKPLAIAGVMGGKHSGISGDTKAVFLESARFGRGSVRSTSLRLGLRSDSSTKFERGVDYFGVEYGRRRALSLFEQLNAGKVVEDRPIEERELKVVTTTIDEINALLGIEIPKKNMIEILSLLGMEVEVDCRNLIVKIPLYREDIDNYTDLAEEIIRFYGYDKMTETFMPTSSVTIGGMTHRQKRVEDIKDLMCALGCYEIMTYSFTDAKVFDKLNLASGDVRREAIRIINPISEDLSVMKTELVSGMISVIATNLTRKNDNFRLFELAKTYKASLPLKDLPQENDTLCVGITGAKEDFFAIKNVFTAVLDRYNVSYDIKPSAEPYLHPGISADLTVEGSVIASFGKLHPSVAKNFGIKKADIFVGYLDCSSVVETKDITVKYKPLPKFQPVERDLAIVIDESVTIGKVMSAIKKSVVDLGAGLMSEVEIFDIYRGEQIEKGHKSVALKIKLIPTEKTLVDAEINKIMDGIRGALIADASINAKVRV